MFQGFHWPPKLILFIPVISQVHLFHELTPTVIDIYEQSRETISPLMDFCDGS